MSASLNQEHDTDSHRWTARADRVLAPTYRRPERLLVRGEGSCVHDAEGRRYLDMTSGVAVNALGHGDATVQEAIRAGADGLVHTSNLFHSQAPIELAEELTGSSFAEKVFYCNSGTEAVEGAIKFARLFGGPLKRKVLAFHGSFHGRTLGALGATDRPEDHMTFGPLPGVYRFAHLNDPEAIPEVDTFTCAVIVEPIQGEGGVREADAEWLARVRRECDRVGALLVFDEVQVGLGRTGRLWAHERLGVTPDLMTLAKPLAGGLPMGAVLMTEKVAEKIRPGDHASTFGGGPFVAGVAREVLRRIRDPELLRDVREKGAWARARLEELDGSLVEEVRGCGLILGVRPTVPAADVRQACLERGLLVVHAGENVVRLLPPLTVTREELAEAIELLHDAMSEVAAAS